MKTDEATFSPKHAQMLARIKARYERRGKAELWNQQTIHEFLRVFLMIPDLSLLQELVDEMLLRPPKDTVGRLLNWLPDPSDLVALYEARSVDAQAQPASIVAEILEKINERGIYGQRVDLPSGGYYYAEGEPDLSEEARLVVRALGGWRNLCLEETPEGVLRGQMLKISEQIANTLHHRKSLPARSLAMIEESM
jgi:hypothetical protein